MRGKLAGAVVLVCAVWNAQGIVVNTRTSATYPTISAAVAAALNGDTLNISTGLYAETVWLTNVALTLRGGYAVDGVTPIANARSYIGGSASGGMQVRFVGPVVLQNLAITGVVNGIALDVRDSAVVTCRYCVIQYNRGTLLGHGGGLVVRYSSRATLYETLVMHNSTPGRGGGAYVTGSAVLTLGDEYTVVGYNYAAQGGGVAVEAGSQLRINNAAVSGNIAVQGGGIYTSNSTVVADGTLAAIGDNYYNGNRATNGEGGGVYALNATLTLTNNARCQANISSSSGGGIHAERSQVYLRSGALVGHVTTNWGNISKSQGGGGLYVRRSTVSLAGAHVAGNSSSGLGGGGIYVRDGSHCTISNSVIRNNVSAGGAGYGGGVLVYSDTIELTSKFVLVASVVSNNACDSSGGGVLVAIGHAGLISGCVFDGNRAQWGGALQNEGSVLRIESSEFNRNRAAQKGGALRCYGGTTEYASSTAFLNDALDGGAAEVLNPGTLLSVSDDRGASANFNSNTATNGGAWHVHSGGHLRVSGHTDMNYNEAWEAGGAAYVSSHGQLTIVCTNGSRVMCQGNRAGRRGGALAVESGAVLDAQGLVCQNNAGALYGGAMYVNNATAQVYDTSAASLRTMPANRMSGNMAVQGGAVMATEYAVLALADALLLTNTANYGGAAYLTYNSRCAAWNLLVISNQVAVSGGAVLAERTSAFSAVHCTLAANTPNGMYVHSAARGLVTNCIVWNTTAFTTNSGGSVAVCYSAVPGGWPGDGNINVYPQFVDPAAVNYQLAFDSPCIDSGVVAGITYDCIGTPRPFGAAPDMGAYEFVPEPGGVWGVLVMGFTIYDLRFTIGRRRKEP